MKTVTDGGPGGIATATAGATPLDAIPGSALAVLADVAAAVGADEIVAEVRDLAERIAEGRFYVTCVGQFKRGKSTLLNALIGESILPTGVAPVTSVVTVVRYDRQPSTQVRLVDHGWRPIDSATLADYVTEERNPKNEKGVEVVEVRVPSPLLETGMCLVDTPGIGSVFASGSLATRKFVPHIDAALVVLGADPPISGEELALVKDVGKHVQEMIFVLNKADRLSDADRAEALAFTRRILKEHLKHPVDAIHEVSAVEALEGSESLRDWNHLRERLESLARQGGAELVRAAEARGRAFLSNRILQEIAEQRDAILRPLTESERRIEVIRQSVEDAERSLSDLAYLLSSEEDRLATTLRARMKEFVDRVLPKALAEFREAVARLDEPRKTRLRERVVSLVWEVSERWLERWRMEQQPFAEAEYRRAADRFIALGNEFLGRLQRAGLTGLPAALGPEAGYRTKSRLYYTNLVTYAPLTLASWILDCVRTRQATRRAAERAAAEYLERLLSANTSRIVGELIDQTLESRRRLEAELRAHIRSVYTTAQRALERARTTQAEGSRAIESEIEKLAELALRIENLGEPGEGRNRA
jgi:GTPase Era involved in 16S rRNA processing